MRPVVVVGDVMTDVVARTSGPLAPGSDTPAAISVSGGGSAANVAAWLTVAGVEVAFVGRCGDDAFGRAAAADLAALGVDVRMAVDPDEPTGTCVVVVDDDGGRSMLPDPGANRWLSPADLPRSLFRPGRHLHLSGYALLRESSREAALTALMRARAAGMSVSVDPSSTAPLQLVGAEAFLSWTRGSDVLLANAAEATVLAGEADPRAAAAALADHYHEAVVKRGAAGALWHGGFISVSCPAQRLHVVDTTGAGDAFAAGYLAEWLLHPEPESALSAANRLAARAVTRVGARP